VTVFIFNLNYKITIHKYMVDNNTNYVATTVIVNSF